MLIHKSQSEIAGDDIGWLSAKHHFAIGSYGNPSHLPVGNLFVLNDDRIAAHSGFPFHGHADVEIVSYVHSGILTHEDGLGNKGHIRAGDVQVMSAGTGIRHSEYNEGDTPLHLFQIWLRPRTRSAKPQWDTRTFPMSERLGRFVPLASGYGASGALPIRADAELYGAVLRAGETTRFEFRAGHSGYLVPVSGAVSVKEQRVEAREGLVIRGDLAVLVKTDEAAEIILITTAE